MKRAQDVGAVGQHTEKLFPSMRGNNDKKKKKNKNKYAQGCTFSEQKAGGYFCHIKINLKISDTQ